jgi:predicted NodU family carbamoyl transferase
MILGYGTSHDSGLAAVDPATGHPLFAATLERLTRKKNDIGSPLRLVGWLEKTLNARLVHWSLLPLEDDAIYRPEKGFHAVEQHADDRTTARWTDAEACIEFEPGETAGAVLVEMFPLLVCKRRQKADVLIDGKLVAEIDNRKTLWIIPNPDPDRLIRDLRIVARQPFTAEGDDRTLGILLAGVILIRGNPDGMRLCRHTVAEAGPAAHLTRLLHKQLFHLPAHGLRLLGPRKCWPVLRDHIIDSVIGRRCHSEWLVGARGLFKMDSNFDHHMCHAASAYYPSGFDKALIVSLDGMGDYYSCRVLLGEAGRLTPLKAYYYEEMPVGLNYEYVTSMLGFNPLRHAGKITGLAAYGKENPECSAALEEFYGDTWERRWKRHDGYAAYLASGFDGARRLARVRETRFGAFSREDIAYAVQKRTEDRVCDLVRKWHERYPDVTSIALAGGVFANVKVNQRVKELGFTSIFVQPAMSDAGLCLGAAILEAVRANGGALKPYRLKDVFLGVEYSDEEIDEAIARAGLAATHVPEDSIARRIAEHIHAGKVVAHFHGRMEFGPRALGNRSILYSAADPDVNRWLNNQLNRTEFMPFAPAVMFEHASEYFIGVEGAEHTAEFMTITFDCTERAKREIPAAIHVDGTARPQLVHKDRNPRFYSILKAYKELSGVPVTINTSFNMHEEPIVASPEDAIRSYQQGKLDVLVMGNQIIESR